ncbi:MULTISPECIES: hypothetical protein [Mesorhizobium]|uniref:Uncharacterized protein n=1 Tax=Mesorhizobium muleiense TaxID=1004279 RepID=A0A1G9L238_9HYPH|nr:MULTISPECIES: hypothetical protein [Mesorhizobium]MCF6102112.1 hypothetical protein [Mesorhizobium muleiense]SDL55767.1 hypothetical protein SAMN05428953_1459 [Mesorhizobium muleiense]
MNLFSNPNDAKTVQTPQWQALPADASISDEADGQLILDHVDSDRTPAQEARYDA